MKGQLDALVMGTIGRTQRGPGNLEMDSVAFEAVAVNFTLEE